MSKEEFVVSITYLVIVAVVVVLVGVLLALAFSRHNRTKRLQNKFGLSMIAQWNQGGKKKAQTELDGRQDM